MHAIMSYAIMSYAIMSYAIMSYAITCFYVCCAVLLVCVDALSLVTVVLFEDFDRAIKVSYIFIFVVAVFATVYNIWIRIRVTKPPAP